MFPGWIARERPARKLTERMISADALEMGYFHRKAAKVAKETQRTLKTEG
jgi:hypothetical protein